MRRHLVHGRKLSRQDQALFLDGVVLPDPTGLFNASLDRNARRAIDLSERAAVDEAALKEVIRAAAARSAGGRR